MPYKYLKYLTTRTASDKIIRDKAFNFANSSQCAGYQRCLTSMNYKFFNKTFSGSVPETTTTDHIKLIKKLT